MANNKVFTFWNVAAGGLVAVSIWLGQGLVNESATNEELQEALAAKQDLIERMKRDHLRLDLGLDVKITGGNTCSQESEDHYEQNYHPITSGRPRVNAFQQCVQTDLKKQAEHNQAELERMKKDLKKLNDDCLLTTRQMRDHKCKPGS